MAVIYIVILIGVLVFVHEFGHYIAARIFDVRVLSFSIGFGPKICGFKRKDTDWEIRALPIGGYVMMYGSDLEEVTEETDPDFSRAYNNKPIWQKVIINLAGPLFNLLLPLPILFGVYLCTVTNGIPSQIGQVIENTPAYGVLQPGDMITSINGNPVRFWTDVSDMIADRPLEATKFTVLRNGSEIEVEMTPDEAFVRDPNDLKTERVGRIGVAPDLAPSVIGIASPNGVAASAGLLTFDEITSINGEPVNSYIELEQKIAANSAQKLNIVALRPTALPIEYGSISILKPVEITIEGNYKSADELGIASANMFITSVDANSPADRAGLAAGDRILEIDGSSINLFRSFADRLTQKWEDPHELTVQRGDDVFKTKIQLEKLTIAGEFQEEVPVIYSGFYNKTSYVMPDVIAKTMSERLGYAVHKSWALTVTASTLIVYSVVRMVQGRMSSKSLGGPILIGHMAAKVGRQGIDMFLKLLALISINLGILNLVPIPILDGGKIAILAVEAVKRGPISMRARQIIAYIGLAMIALLLMLALKNDLERLWNAFFG